MSLSWGRIDEKNLLGPSTGNIVLDDKDMMDFLIIIILTEHMIVVVKVIMMDYIGDVPIWVQKKLITVNSKQEELNIEFKKIEMK